MSGLVSVIMPSYNTGKFIAESIASVVAQTYTDWELIIVDDASTDNTDEVVQRVILSGAQAKSKDLPSLRIRYLKNDRNRGAAYSRNRALREARGKWIAFLDSDDIWTPDKLEKQIAFMEKNGYAFSYTRYGEMDENGNPTGTVVSGPKRITKTGMYNYCWPGCLTVMYDREVVRDIQIADIRKNNDYAMWLKIVRKANCHLLAENLATYRKRSGSITHAQRHCEEPQDDVAVLCHPERSGAKSLAPNYNQDPALAPRGRDLKSKFSMIQWHYKLYREAEGLNPITSLWITARNLFFGVWKKIKYVGRE